MSVEAVLTAREQFAADRGVVLDKTDDELRPVVEDALESYVLGQHDWYDDIVDGAAVLWHETFEAEQGRAPTSTELAEFQSNMADALDHTTEPDDPPSDTQVDTITRWASTYAVNAATAAGGGDVEWVTRHDADVRTAHQPLDGRLRGEDGTWSVGGYDLHFPGEPVGPPAVWINCRCLARRVQEDEMSTTAAAAPAATEEQDPAIVPDDGATEEEAPPWSDDMDTDVEWHGVAAPIGQMSGDRRKFTQMLRNRDLPLPLTWQKAEDSGHNGAVVVGNIESLRHNPDTNVIEAAGRFHTSPESDEVISLIANGMLRGISVALDDATVEYQNEDGTTYDLDNPSDIPPVQAVTDGRIASATIVPIPAFQEGYLALGPWEDQEASDAEQLAAAGCAPCEAMAEAEEWMAEKHFAVSEAAWDGSASRFDDDQWKNSCILDRGTGDTPKTRYALPIKEPGGSLSRAGVHAAASRLDQTDAPDAAKAAAKRKLLAAYRQLDEDPPESIAASAFVDLVDGEVTATFVVASADPTPDEAGWKVTYAPGTHDGPGWVTHPRDSQRLRDYWTRGEGAAKIQWGRPGDFNRCRKHLAKYVPNPEWLAGTCANLHKVAISLWPGQETGKKHAVEDGMVAAAAYEFAVEEYPTPPAEWFTDPHLDGPTPLTIEDTGRVFGHLAVFGTCHIGYGLAIGGDGCTDVPRSDSDYAYYNVGAVLCDDDTYASVGHITLGTGHAPGRLRAMPAAAHYDNTGSVVADVHAGEDEHGVWVAGWVRPGVSAEQLANLRAASLSGDWRKVRGSYELVAALAVNVPGFPIPRLEVAASGREAYSLVAAGIVEREPDPPEPLTIADIKAAFGRLTEAFAAMGQALTAGLAQQTKDDYVPEPTPTLVAVEAARSKIRAVKAAQARDKIRAM